MQVSATVEALYSATYVSNYLDSVENLPDDIQRHLSRIRELDVQCRSHLRDVDYYYEQWSSCGGGTDQESVPSSKKNRAMTRIQQCLIAVQELGDEKLQLVTQFQELIDQKTRQLECDFKNLDYGKDEPAHQPAEPMILKDTSVRPITPSIASPVNPIVPLITNPQSTTLNSTTPHASGLPTNGATSTTTTERTSNTSASTNNGNNERASKRIRRTKNEGAGSGVDISNSDISAIVEPPPTKQITAVQSTSNHTTAAQNKKATNVGGTNAGGNSGGKKKKRKANRQSSGQAREARDDTPPPEEAIDPDEPTYCLCDQISFGEMILCDNDLCPIEWFHFSCVSLVTKPKGKWFCPNCRGDRPNVMKPKAQFLKELERYNKEKEEKT